MTLAALSRDGRRDLVLFLHGLGCVKENFLPLWDAPELAGMALLAPDLPGHGASQGLPPDSWTMAGMTRALHELLAGRPRRTDRLHIVAHSMGGAPGLLLARRSPIRLATFVNLEANLVAEDCALFSRRVAETEPSRFRDEKFARLKARARDSDDPVVRAWAGWMEACPTAALHASASSLVAWSDGGTLLEVFRALGVPKAYICGERSAIPEVLARIEGIPTYRIPECGHFAMLEKPAELSRLLGTVLSRAD